MPVNFLGDAYGQERLSFTPIEAIQQWWWRRLLLRDIRSSAGRKSSRVMQPRTVLAAAMMALCMVFAIAGFLVWTAVSESSLKPTSAMVRTTPSASEPIADLVPPAEFGGATSFSGSLIPISTGTVRRESSAPHWSRTSRHHSAAKVHKSHRREMLSRREEEELANEVTVRHFEPARAMQDTRSNQIVNSAATLRQPTKKVTVIN